MEYNTTIEKKGYASTELVEKTTPTMPNPFRFTPEEQASYFTQLQQQYADNCSQAENEMRAWEIGYEFHHDPPLDLEAYTLKINEQLKVLTNQDSGLIVAKFYHNGILDNLKLGKYLVSLYPSPEKQRTATATFHAIVYLSSQKDKLKEQLSPTTINNPPLESEYKNSPVKNKKRENMTEEEETIFFNYMIKNLKLPVAPKTKVEYDENHKFWQGQVLFALHQYCEDIGMSCACSIQKIAEKIRPIIAPDKTTNSVQQLIGRANEKGKKTYIGEVRLKNLTAKVIEEATGIKSLAAKNRLKHWDGLYDIVKQTAEKYYMTYNYEH